MAPLYDDQNDKAAAQKAYEEASVASERMIALKPEKSEYHVNHASIYTKLGQRLAEEGKVKEAMSAYDSAVATMREAIELNQKEPKYWNKIGTIYLEQMALLHRQQKKI